MGSRGPAPEGESSKSCSTRWESGACSRSSSWRPPPEHLERGSTNSPTNQAWWLRQRPELQVTLRSHIMTTHPPTLKQTIRTKPLIGRARDFPDLELVFRV